MKLSKEAAVVAGAITKNEWLVEKAKEIKDKEEIDMCEALERYAKAYKDEGKHEGRIEGKIEGRREGLIEGEQKTLSDAIQSLMIELKISKERAMQLLRIYQDEHGLYRYCVVR